MSTWSNTVITDKGISLLTKLIEGNTLSITRAVTGTGYTTPGLIQALTEIEDPKQTLEFKKVTYPEYGKCCLPCRLTNDEVETGYKARQLGIYAMDPDEGEILFFVAQAPIDGGTDVPAKDELIGYAAEWSFYFQYGRADNVTLLVDPSNTVNNDEMVEYVSKYVAALVATIPEINAVTS